ncbi:MAG: PSD1 and planctomycete cytochrome C domain-containing protein, partial [Planctomycetota bacterium]
MRRIYLASLTLLLASTVVADDQVRRVQREFTLKVLPTLRIKCFGCHGDDKDKVRGDLDMRSRAALLKGGESKTSALVPGHPEKSLIVKAIRWQDDLEMPPKENDRLSEREIEAVERWIRAGAPWPEAETRKKIIEHEKTVLRNEDGELVHTSGGLSDDWTYRRYAPEDLWAWKPVQAVTPPKSVGSAIDAFVDARRQASGFEAAPAADPITLLRRATFDLTGLPPSPAELEAFQSDWAGNPDAAWIGAIDRLLSSPHYGERWAQHWLDIVRYADTGGYSNDYERSNAWRYRDYVIRSFQNDKPFSEFIVEQLAGDELADHSLKRRSDGNQALVNQTRFSGAYNEQEAEWIVATGFLRMGPWDNAMVKAPQARQIYLDDVVNSVGVSFLSTALRCVKCHDHKFDPIPTRDYYRIYAAFSATQMAERPVRFLGSENRIGFKEERNLVNHLANFATERKTKIKTKQEDAARRWFSERGLPYLTENERKDLPDEKKPPRHVGLDHVDEGRLKVREQDEWIWLRRLERFQPFAQAVYNGPDVKPRWNRARKLRIAQKNKQADLAENFILMGGALEAPGPAVRPGVLSGLGLRVPISVPIEEKTADGFVLTKSEHGRRLGLARWIASDANPLSTRSIVNRIWQHHFGFGLARNPNNFGAKGGKPTHPELLDWLTHDFVAHDWKIKRLHRSIMLSKTYRQASTHPKLDELRTKDPENRLLAYFPIRRLSAEELRDATLAVTGELVRTGGGIPIRPEINMEVALQPRMIQFSVAPAYQPSRTKA